MSRKRPHPSDGAEDPAAKRTSTLAARASAMQATIAARLAKATAGGKVTITGAPAAGSAKDAAAAAKRTILPPAVRIVDGKVVGAFCVRAIANGARDIW